MTRKRHASKDKRTSKQKRKARRGRNIPWLWIGIASLGVLILGGVWIYVAGQPSNQLPEEISASVAYQKYQQGAFFVDVRDTAEWEAVHIPNSVSIPLNQLQNRLGELPRDKEIVLICLLGMRSKEGQEILLQAGFNRVTCLTRGLESWHAAGYPLEGNQLE